ncbi:response regulator [Cohnella hashimotonis]|uniref:Response regulator n=1 Tax=Cohnella hashimotonis TaxID=2826895 RepID=A0ABT6TT74_9BACL|nr:response regulator [Cohnella hashimotonis]MDI4649711.1 response regulator [Cohnella hashimotonis]
MDEPAMKVLVVDDEPMARRRIRSFALEERGFVIAGEAENGEQAWRMIRESPPDIVVADIGMPVLDGLRLLERVRGLASAPKVILLTCYEDFDKIQAALRLGAHDYITKLLLSEAEFVACLSKAADDIRRERRHRHKAIRQLLLELLLSGDEARASLEQLAALSFPARQHRLALVRFAPERGRTLHPAEPAFEDESGPYASLVLPVEPGLWAMIAVSRERSEGADFLAWTMNALRRGGEACRALGVPTVQALSDRRGDLLLLPRALAECRRLLDAAFYAPLGEPVTPRNETAPGEYPPDRLDALLRDCRTAMERHDYAAAGETLLRWADEAAAHRPAPARLRLIGAALAGCLHDGPVRLRDGTEAQLRQRLQQRIAAAGHMTELREAVEEAAELLRETPSPAPAIRSEIREALRLIETEYGEDLDLQAAARHVSLSPSWFGALFRQETGQSFSDYLQDYRLERARELLLRTDLKIYEVAAGTGIPNSRYFSRLFADKYETSPQEYRARMREARCRR